MSKSIMHSKYDRTCYLCMRLNQDYMMRSGLQEHHVVFGTANRRLSEKYGLKVYLCDEHHEHSPMAVHVNAEVRQQLCEEAQRAFERVYPNLSFRDIFGINYINDVRETAKSQSAEGFRYTPELWEDSDNDDVEW